MKKFAWLSLNLGSVRGADSCFLAKELEVSTSMWVVENQAYLVGVWSNEFVKASKVRQTFTEFLAVVLLALILRGTKVSGLLFKPRRVPQFPTDVYMLH